MRAFITVAALAAVSAGCGSKSKDNSVAGCDLAGLYRLRFDAGVGQWLWLRFRIAPNGMSATLEKPTAFADDVDTLKLDPDPAGCKASVTVASQRGDLLAHVTLDPKTNKVTGKLRFVEDREGMVLEGVRDPSGVPTGPNACIKPGMYRLVVPAEQAWQSDEEGADCEGAELAVSFLVEPFGDKLLVEQIRPDGTSAWAAEDTSIAGPCDVEVRFRHRDHTVHGRVTFGGDTVTARGRHVNVEHVTAGGDRYRCTVSDPILWVERERS
jgi:hypothetical protein